MPDPDFNVPDLPADTTAVIEETPVVVEDYPVVPLPLPEVKESPVSDFDYKAFRQNGRIDFSPEYFQDIMSLYKGQKSVGEEGGPSYTPTQAFAIQAAKEFNARTGMGDYKALKEGTSKYKPGVEFTDKMILKYLTTMEEKGFLESIAAQMVQNVPGSAAFGAGFAAGKKIQKIMPALNQRFQVGFPRVDKILNVAQTAYVGTRAVVPYVTGIASSIFADGNFGEPFAEFFLGKKTLPTPDSYPVMRAGQVVADIGAFTPYAFVADKAAADTLTDYFSNRLAFSTIPTSQGPVEAFGRGFDFSGKGPSGTFSQQWKNAVEIAKNKRATSSARTNLAEEGVEAGPPGKFRGTRDGKEFQGPLNINDLNERGVAAVLQGKTAPATLRILSTIESAIKKSGVDARKNPKLTLFYETIAAGGAAAVVEQMAASNPFGAGETIGEIAGGVFTPMLAGQLSIGIGRKIAPYVKDLFKNVKDRGAGGIFFTVKEGADQLKREQGFKLILQQLESLGSLDDPEQLQALIKKLEGASAGATAGTATRDPAIMALEAALAREGDNGLAGAQLLAKQKELKYLETVLDQLAFGEGTAFEKDTVRVAAQIREALYTQSINGRLSNSENKLLKAHAQIQKSRTTGLGVDGQPLSAEELADLESEDMMDLSNRLVQMLSAQKGFARGQQKTLYSKVGNLDINAFFDDDGAPVALPKFIRLLDSEGIIDGTSVKDELRKLYQFAQKQSDALGLGLDIDRSTPKLDGYNTSRTKLTGSASLDFFDNFTAKLSDSFSNDGLPNVVTDAMVDQVRQARNRRGGEKIKDTFNLYDNYMDALIEKKTLQGSNVSANAENAARQAQLDSFDVEASLFAENLNDTETSDFNEFLISIDSLTPSEKSVSIKNFVSRNALRPTAHPGIPMAEKLEFIAKNPGVQAGEEGAGIAGISLEELRQMRSEALGIARDGNAKPESRRVAGMFASAIEDDLSNFANFASTDDVPKNQIKALRVANSFTKSFSDVYYRSYVGDALAQTRDGGFRIAPETLAESFGKNRFDPNFLKIREIENVGKFAREQGIPGAEGSVDSIHGVMDRILRAGRAAALDPETGELTQKGLTKWIKANDRLAQLFPELFEDLKNFNVAKSLFDQTKLQTSASQAFINKQINFTSLLMDSKGQIRSNPASAIAEAMAGGKDQGPALSRLIDVIPKGNDVVKKTVYEITDVDTGLVSKFFTKKDALNALQTMGPNAKLSQNNLSVNREEAIEGFKAGFFEYLVFGNPSGRGANKNVAIEDPLRLYRDLFEKKILIGGTPNSIRGDRTRYSTLSEFLKKKGVFNDADIGGITKTLEALILAKSGDAAGMLGEDFEKAKPLLDFALAISGSAIGTKSQSLLTGGQGGPGSIIAAGKGAEAMRNIFLRMPQSQRMLFTAELLQNPKLMGQMLRKYGSDEQSAGVIGSITNWLKTNGFSTVPRRLFAIGEGEEAGEIKEGEFNPEIFKQEVPEYPVVPPLPTNDQQGAFVPPPVPQRPSPVVSPTTQASAVPSPPPKPVNSGPVDRTRYAALFPNDSISGMMNTQQLAQGGIASLMR